MPQCKNSTGKVTSFQPYSSAASCLSDVMKEESSCISPSASKMVSPTTLYVLGGGGCFSSFLGESLSKRINIADMAQWHTDPQPPEENTCITVRGEKNKLIIVKGKKRQQSIYVRVLVIVTLAEWCRDSLIISQESDKISVPWRDYIDFLSAKATYSLCGGPR